MHSRDAVKQALDEIGGLTPVAARYPWLSSHHRGPELSNILYTASPQSAAAVANGAPAQVGVKPLYTPEQRRRRDATRWTLVQGVLAPVQFLVFLVSVSLVLRYLATGEGFALATTSVVIKTIALYAIMVTGAIWEREVFGVYLFAPAFLWEDVFSFLVLALHSGYLVALFAGYGSAQQQMALALAAYATYAINATQFVLKLRAARRDERLMAASPAAAGGRA